MITNQPNGSHAAPIRFQLLRATPDDFATVATLFEALHTWNAELDARFALADDWRDLLDIHFAKTWNSPRALWLLAWHETTPAGLLLVEAHTDSPLFRHRSWAELAAIYVAPAYRGCTLARELVALGGRWTAAQGFDRMQLYVTASNERARQFYRRCGLLPVQEIWRLNLPPEPAAASTDDDNADSDAAHAWGVELLEAGRSYLLCSQPQRGSDDA